MSPLRETLSLGDSHIGDQDLAVEFVFREKIRGVCQTPGRMAFLERHTALCELHELKFPHHDLVASLTKPGDNFIRYPPWF